MDIFIKDAIYGVLAKAMHSGDRSYGMIFNHFKKRRLSIKNSCFSIIELRRDIFIKTSVTVLASKAMIVDTQNNKHGTKREMFELNGFSTFRNMMTNGTTVRTKKIIDGRFKMNIYNHNSIITDFFKNATLGIGEREQNCEKNH